MILAQILLLASVLLTTIIGDAEAEKRAPCPCGEAEAEKAVLARQRDFFQALQSCDIKRIVDELIVPGSNGMAIDRACPDDSCCVNTGLLASYWSYNICNSLIFHPEGSFTLTWLKNGTAVFTFNEVYSAQFFPDDQAILLGSTYWYSFYWDPQPGARCDYRLGYMRAYDAHCPADVEMRCEECWMRGKKKGRKPVFSHNRSTRNH
jgi:hypothetical protein